jgi:hypothetical protein
MLKKQQEEHFKILTDKLAGIMLSKGNDYSNEDRLSNFKLGGAIAGLTPQQHCLALISTKVARLGVLLNHGNLKPNNESIQDSVEDLTLYGALLHMLVVENVQTPVNEKEAPLPAYLHA